MKKYAAKAMWAMIGLFILGTCVKMYALDHGLNVAL